MISLLITIPSNVLVINFHVILLHIRHMLTDTGPVSKATELFHRLPASRSSKRLASPFVHPPTHPIPKTPFRIKTAH